MIFHRRPRCLDMKSRGRMMFWGGSYAHQYPLVCTLYGCVVSPHFSRRLTSLSLSRSVSPQRCALRQQARPSPSVCLTTGRSSMLTPWRRPARLASSLPTSASARVSSPTSSPSQSTRTSFKKRSLLSSINDRQRGCNLFDLYC